MWQKTGSRKRRAGSRCPQGFTLMEIVVAMVIFTLASVVIAEIFVNVQRAQQRVRDTQVALTELRYLMEVLAREVRSDALDYSPAGDCANSAGAIAALNSTLQLCSGQNVPVQFQRATDVDCGFGTGFSGGCVQVRRGTAAWNTISSAAISIDALWFMPTPTANPFPESGATALTPDVQPRVTMVLKASSLNVRLQDRKPLYLQTSVTSRTYVR